MFKVLSGLMMMGLAAAALAGTPATPNGLLEILAQGGITEVEAGKLALTKATTPGVKAFAERTVKDHSASNQKVNSLAATRSLTLPKTPSEAQQETMKALHANSGPQFDQAYLAAQVKAHEETTADRRIAPEGSLPARRHGRAVGPGAGVGRIGCAGDGPVIHSARLANARRCARSSAG